MKGNEIVGDPDWCGHAFVSLRNWRCADCHRPFTTAAREYLEGTPTVLPPGWVWVLEIGEQDEDGDDAHTRTWTLGVFSDRSRIAALLVRNHWVDKADLRKRLCVIHWYQGAFNRYIFEGWAEENDGHGEAPFYRVDVEKIDQPGAVIWERSI